MAISKKVIKFSIDILLATMLLSACFTSAGAVTPEGGTATLEATVPTIGHRTKTAGCMAMNGLPDSACTPGAVFADVTTDQVCTPGYSKNVRNVPESEKNAVYTEYGITQHSTGEYEVDHLISLELGGSNDIANLWPEAADPRPGFHEKDKVENYLHEQMCSGAMTMQQAQAEIARDWLAVYQSMPK
jgi:hypothetical protein